MGSRTSPSSTVFPLGLRALLVVGVFSLLLGISSYRFWTTAPRDHHMVIEGHVGQWVYAVKGAGDYVYIGQGSRVAVVDIRHPEQPRLIEESEEGRDPITALALHHHILYALSRKGGIRIFDVSSPEHLQEVGTYWSADWGWLEDVTVAGDFLYVAAGWAGMWILDLHVPQQPRPRGHFAVRRYASGIAVNGSSYAYVADWDQGVHVVDIQDPDAPHGVGHVDTPGRAGKVAYQDHVLYVADGGGLQVLDVSTPSHPVPMAYFHTPGWTFGMAADEGYVALACGEPGLWLFNARRPSEPRVVGILDTPGDGNKVDVALPYLYVADGRAGLTVVRWEEEARKT